MSSAPCTATLAGKLLLSCDVICALQLQPPFFSFTFLLSLDLILNSEARNLKQLGEWRASVPMLA